MRNGTVRYGGGVIALVLTFCATRAPATERPVLLYDGWTGDLSIRANDRLIDALEVRADPPMFVTWEARFPGSVDLETVTSEQLSIYSAQHPFGDFDFGRILPAGMEAREVEAEITARVSYPGTTAWDGIVVDLGADPINHPIGPSTPEPATATWLVSLILLRSRRAR